MLIRMRNNPTLHLICFITFMLYSGKFSFLIGCQKTFLILNTADVFIAIGKHLIITFMITVKVRRRFTCTVTANILPRIFGIITCLYLFCHFIRIDVRTENTFLHRTVSFKDLIGSMIAATVGCRNGDEPRKRNIPTALGTNAVCSLFDCMQRFIDLFYFILRMFIQSGIFTSLIYLCAMITWMIIVMR